LTTPCKIWYLYSN